MQASERTFYFRLSLITAALGIGLLTLGGQWGSQYLPYWCIFLAAACFAARTYFQPTRPKLARLLGITDISLIIAALALFFGMSHS